MICLFLHQVFSFEVVPYSCLSSVSDVSCTNPLAKRQSVPSMISLSETTAVFTGRSVLSKHKGFSLYRPSALLLAQTIGDMPLYFVMIVMFTLIVYFMTGLQVDPGLYFIYLLFIYFTTLCTITLFRSIGYAFNTFNNASKASGFALLMLSMARQSEQGHSRVDC